ncbi:palmitoyltransferase ZDHHC15B isoform X2 [Phyllopteryx taeniolatus]|uniref:palmitoyltransferase ZDHHC15B isoform X2 n=1 Tax=Phyllopteryx taeniolatus TaxID=161469 RepID=UPI002AD400FE|nr:palmitoyltransferase ZDHHC15B isoform X2 [Phyllopteryx taeniolatus]
MALSRGLRCCQRVFSWLPVLIIASVVLWSYYAYVFQLCLFTLSNTLEKVAYLLVFHVCFGMFSWTYWKSIFTPAASPCKKFQLSYSDKQRYEMEERPNAQKQILVEIAKKLPIHTRAQSGAIRFCDRCQVLKPDRCHHCSVCETCVLKMDHHCPWVNNCVGFSNYKFFLLFLFYSMLYCIYIAATVFQYFIKFWVGDLPNGPAKFHVLFLMFVALMFFVSLMFLFGYHCWLVVKNRSTLEAFSAPFFVNGPDRQGFNIGIRKNLQQVFGKDRRLWFIPVFTRTASTAPLEGRASSEAARSTSSAGPFPHYGRGLLEPIPAIFGQEPGYTLNRSPANRRAHGNKKTFTLTGNLGSSINLLRMFLGCGRFYPCLDKTHPGTGRTCKLHTDGPGFEPRSPEL